MVALANSGISLFSLAHSWVDSLSKIPSFWNENTGFSTEENTPAGIIQKSNSITIVHSSVSQLLLCCIPNVFCLLFRIPTRKSSGNDQALIHFWLHSDDGNQGIIITYFWGQSNLTLFAYFIWEIISMFDSEIFISCIVAMANPETECSPRKNYFQYHWRFHLFIFLVLAFFDSYLTRI